MSFPSRLRLSVCFLFFTVILAGASHVLAADPIDDRVQDLQRDQLLIHTLVDGGLKLAEQDDPLQRADQCSRMADAFAREIDQAVEAKNGARAAHLGDQMHLLMVQGVAANLSQARAAMEPDSPRQPQIARVGAEIAGTAKRVEDTIAKHPTLEPAKMKSTLQAINKGKIEVEKALVAKSKAKAKTDKGKKGKF